MIEREARGVQRVAVELESTPVGVGKGLIGPTGDMVVATIPFTITGPGTAPGTGAEAVLPVGAVSVVFAGWFGVLAGDSANGIGAGWRSQNKTAIAAMTEKPAAATIAKNTIRFTASIWS